MGGKEIHRHGYIERKGWTPDPACRNGTCGLGFYRIINREDGSRGPWRWQRVYDKRHAHMKLTTADSNWRCLTIKIESTAPLMMNRFIPKARHDSAATGWGAWHPDRPPVLVKFRVATREE